MRKGWNGEKIYLQGESRDGAFGLDEYQGGKRRGLRNLH